MHSEIQFLEITISRMEDEIYRINVNKASLNRRLNELSAPSGSAPPEILATIFSRVCADLRSFKPLNVRYPHIQVISQVCSTWRYIVATTPSFWTRINIRLPHAEWAIVTSLDLLRLHYANAQTLPLAITLHLAPPDYYPPMAFYETRNLYTPCIQVFRLIFAEHPSRLETFTIGCRMNINTPPSWLDTIASFTNLPNEHLPAYPNLLALDLGYLHAGVTGASNYQFKVFNDAPIPRLRSWTSSNGLAVQIPLDDITVIRFSRSKPKESLEILARLPRLTEFHSIFMHPSIEDPKPSSLVSRRSIISLADLHTFSWSFGFEAWDIHLMLYFEFPSLLSLFRYHDCRTDQAIWPLESIGFSTHSLDCWSHFLASLTSLQSFGCPTSFLSTETAEGLWAPLTNVSSLTELHFWSGFTMTAVGLPTGQVTDGAILRYLTLPSGFRHSSNSQTIPSIRVKDIHLYHPIPLDRIDSWLSMLESRQNPPEGFSPLESLTFYVEQSDVQVEIQPAWVYWNLKQRRRLQSLVEEGFKVATKEATIIPFWKW